MLGCGGPPAGPKCPLVSFRETELTRRSCVRALRVWACGWRRGEDVQVEFVMLDPYVRLPLTPDGSGTFRCVCPGMDGIRLRATGRPPGGQPGRVGRPGARIIMWRRLAFKVPDVYGVFKYVIDYKHLGYSYVQLTQQVCARRALTPAVKVLPLASPTLVSPLVSHAASWRSALRACQVPVRPFKHNEYERFLVCAYPYYASAISGMAAFFVLGFFYLYTK